MSFFHSFGSCRLVSDILLLQERGVQEQQESLSRPHLKVLASPLKDGSSTLLSAFLQAYMLTWFLYSCYGVLLIIHCIQGDDKVETPRIKPKTMLLLSFTEKVARPVK